MRVPKILHNMNTLQNITTFHIKNLAVLLFLPGAYKRQRREGA